MPSTMNNKAHLLHALCALPIKEMRLRHCEIHELSQSHGCTRGICIIVAAVATLTCAKSPIPEIAPGASMSPTVVRGGEPYADMGG